MRLLHLTDPHLSSLEETSIWKLAGKRRLGYMSWRRFRRRIHRSDVLQVLTNAILAERADQILVTGDLTHLGLPHEIQQGYSWLRELGSPESVTLVPGNHDAYTFESRAEALGCWADYLHLPEEKNFPTLQILDDVAIVGLSSAVPSPVFMASGRLGKTQLTRLRTLLSQVPDRFICFLVHHSPVQNFPSPRRALVDAGLLEPMIGNVQAGFVLHGHIHRNQETILSGGLRVYGTASASSADLTRPASYRVFDLHKSGEGWSIKMSLKTLTSGKVSRVSEDSWLV